MSEISRRRVAGGVAWAVPIIVVGTAVAATASSGAPVLGPVAEAGEGSEGNKSVELVIPAENLVVGATYTLVISSITNTVGNGTTWTVPDVTTFTYTGGPITSVVLKNNAGAPGVTWTASYTLAQNGVGVVASGTFTFVY
jgi:hypothetical protein